ncbi:YqcI/YcgG family protein [Croceicoccus sp. 1NDH52]|nr:YqcI/YcgG family protein [Croceicoccus gelatinilyticus]
MTADIDRKIATQFEDFIRDRDFPCVGAKSALSKGTLKVSVCRSMTSNWDDVRIHRELLDWSFDYQNDPGLFRSLAFIFKENEDLDERSFEAAMWERIQSLADKDAWLEQPYDNRVSPDPNDPHFSLSFGGEAFFVVGMHPRASRPARRFERPALVFNLCQRRSKSRPFGGVKPGHRVTCRGEWREGVARGPLPPALV